MKKILLLAALAVAVCAQAQPEIGSQFYPKIGHVQKIVTVDTAGIGPGAAGSDVTWDYSVLNHFIGIPWTHFEYLSPGLLPYSDGPFLSANVGGRITEVGDTTSQFYTYFRTGTDWKWLGTGDGFTAPFVFSDPLVLLEPVPFDGAFNDTARLSYGFDGFTFAQYIEEEVWYRAYGTLHLPTGTFENVIQLEYNLMQIDTFILEGDFYSIDTTYTQSWRWMAAGFPGPLLTYTITQGSSTLIVNGQAPEYSTFGPDHDAEYDFDSSLTSVSDPDVPLFPAMQLYPNPVTDVAWLRLTSEAAMNGAVLSLWNGTGQLIRTHRIDVLPGDNQFELPVNDLPTGLYAVTVEGNGHAQTVRLIVR